MGAFDIVVIVDALDGSDVPPELVEVTVKMYWVFSVNPNTIIGENTYLDNQVHVAHNVKIGNNCIIAGQVGIAGSTTLGNNVVIGGQAGISGHLKIGNNVQIGGGSGVINDIGDNSKVMGYPAKDFKKFIKESR